jgi:cytochrome c oxidase subunit 2
LNPILHGVASRTGSLLLAGDEGTFWLPSAKSTAASDVDGLFYFILGIDVFFFLLIVAMMLVFLVKYRRRGEEATTEKSSHHSTLLELAWSGIPLLLVLAIFAVGFRGYMNLQRPPADTYDIEVTAQKWSWSFTYPNGYEDGELHVPAGRPIKLVMSSKDVIHSFFVPDFRVKMDVVPGRYSTTWFEAPEPGESPIYCAEYCGTSHSEMLSRVVVHEPAEFEAWLAEAANWMAGLPPEEAGEKLYAKKGCVQCHTTTGAAGIGPTFLGAWGKTRNFTDGSSGPMDENYVRESVLQPQAKIVAGFDPVMPTFQGRLNDEEIRALIAYLKSLSE